jgi:hypothetical protein
MISGPLVNVSSQTAVPFQFPFIVLLRHVRGAIFNLQPSSSSPRSLLQLQSSSPTSSLFNFNPPCQLHPSSPPTSTLVARAGYRADSARLGLARYPNELARLGSLSLTSSKASSARLMKNLGSARLAREPSTWTCNRMIIYRCYITYLSIKHTYITYLSIKHIK